MNLLSSDLEIFGIAPAFALDRDALDARWKDLQLPVYVLWASETYGGHPSAAYYALPANPMDIGISSWDSLHDTMPGYEECALDSARSWRWN